MAGKRAAHRYAKAIMALAQEHNNIDKIDSDIRSINETLKASKDLRVVLKSPVINNELKRSSLHAIFNDVDKYTLNLMDVLLQNRRIDLLPDVCQAFIDLVDQSNNVTTAEVTTAAPLTPEMEQNIIAKVKELTGNEASLTKRVDEKLLGGFLLRIGDLQYDASIAGKLNSLKREFKQNAYS